MNSAEVIHIFGTVTGPADPEHEFMGFVPAHRIIGVDLATDGAAVVSIDRGEDCAPWRLIAIPQRSRRSP